MDEMQICTIRDLMQKSGCQTLKEFGEYLALSQSMDEMEKAENEYKAALAELKAALENEETAEQMQELLSMPEVENVLDGTDQLLQMSDALKRLAQCDHDAKAELLDVSEKLPDALHSGHRWSICTPCWAGSPMLYKLPPISRKCRRVLRRSKG